MKVTDLTPPPADIVFLRRLGFGVTDSDVSTFNMGGGNLSSRVSAWVNQQLAVPTDLTKTDISPYLKTGAFYSLNLTTTEEWTKFVEDQPRQFSTNGISDRPIREHELLTAIRAMHSKFQSFERLSLFWHDHFYIKGHNGYAKSLWGSWDRTLRESLMGNFYTFLRKVVEHPAFILHFENQKNVSAAIHEHLARELFDLHTAGTDAYFVLDAGEAMPTYSSRDAVPAAWHGQPRGYNDDDVLSAALMLTGWQINPPNEARGQFYYNNGESKTSRITVLKHRYEEKGVGAENYQQFAINNDDHARVLKGRHMLHRMATHPATAQHIATKLAKHFISDNPPQNVIDAVAKTFLDNVEDNQQLKKCYFTLFKHPAMRNASTWGEKKMRPFEMLASACRATGCERKWRDATLAEGEKIRNIESNFNNGQWEAEKARQIPTYYEISQSRQIVVDKLTKTGQRLFNAQDDHGYPDHAHYWSSGDTLMMTLKMIDAAGELKEDNLLNAARNQNEPLLPIFSQTQNAIAQLTPRNIVTYWAKRIWQVAPTDRQLEPYLTFFCTATQSRWGDWDKDTVIAPLNIADSDYPKHQWNRKIRALVVALFAHPYAQLR